MAEFKKIPRKAELVLEKGKELTLERLLFEIKQRTMSVGRCNEDFTRVFVKFEKCHARYDTFKVNKGEIVVRDFLDNSEIVVGKILYIEFLNRVTKIAA